MGGRVVAFAGLAVASPSGSQAARLFFNQIDQATGVASGIGVDRTSIPVVPTLNLNEGDTASLHVWFRPDVRTTAAQNEKYVTVAYDIEASDPAVVTRTGHTMVNPEREVGSGEFRWDGVDDGTAAAVSPLLVRNALGVGVLTAGVGNNPANYSVDLGYDAISGAFYLGRLDIRASDIATQTARTGLYFRVGNAGIVQGPPPATPPLADVQFGSSTTSYTGDQFGVGDPVTADLAQANAIINVMGGGGPAREVIQFVDDPTNTGPLFTAGPPANVEPRNFAVTPPNSMVQLDLKGVQHNFFDVFFDINVDDPGQLQALATALAAQEADDGINFVNVVPNGANPLLNGIDYDLHLQYTNTPGNDRFLDVNASQAVSGVPGILINNVAIPEPSTWALVACGLIGLGLARRRRAA